MIDILERWEKTNLLRNVPADIKAEMAYVLENQIQHNAHIKDESRISVPTFRRLSVPLARRVFPALESHRKYTITAKPYLESCLVADLGVKGTWDADAGMQYDGHGGCNLDREAAAVAQLAETLGERVDRLIEASRPFRSFSFQCFGTTPEGSVTLYYDLD